MMSMMCAYGVFEYMDETQEELVIVMQYSLNINTKYSIQSRINGFLKSLVYNYVSELIHNHIIGKATVREQW